MFKVQINGDKNSLKLLDKNFKNIKVTESNYFLECPEFEKLNEKDILPFAKENLKQMSTIIKLKMGYSCKIEIAAIESTKKDGTKCMSIPVPPACSECRATAPSIVITNKETGKIIQDSQRSPEDLNPYLKCISKNKYIQEVINCFQQLNSSNFAFNYYKIIEIIGNDLGGQNNIKKEFKISKKKFSNLTGTLNNGLGEKSRHYPELKNKKLSEERILSEEEVKEIMNYIIKEWLSMKCK